jgi:hypothetical protein
MLPGPLLEVADDERRISQDAERPGPQVLWNSLPLAQEQLDPMPAFERVGGNPVALQGHCDSKSQVNVTGERPLESSAQIGGLGSHDLRSLRSLGLVAETSRLGDGEKEFGETPAPVLGLAGLLEPLERKLPNRLEHAEAAPGPALQKTLLD